MVSVLVLDALMCAHYIQYILAFGKLSDIEAGYSTVCDHMLDHIVGIVRKESEKWEHNDLWQ